jgi:hypothetical protein
MNDYGHKGLQRMTQKGKILQKERIALKTSRFLMLTERNELKNAPALSHH